MKYVIRDKILNAVPITNSCHLLTSCLLNDAHTLPTTQLLLNLSLVSVYLEIVPEERRG